MDIEDFVKKTIEQVKANITKCENGGYRSGDTYMDSPVEFDLAVVVTESDTEEDKIKGGGNIKVLSANGEASKSTETKNETTSRIKFAIHIVN